MGDLIALLGGFGILLGFLPVIFVVVFMFYVMYALNNIGRELDWLNRQVKAWREKPDDID